MIHITIFDDDFPTVLKDMSVTIDPEKYKGSHMTLRGTTNKLDEEVRKQAKDLLDCWWSHRSRSAEELYGEEIEDDCVSVSLPLMVAFDGNVHKTA